MAGVEDLLSEIQPALDELVATAAKLAQDYIDLQAKDPEGSSIPTLSAELVKKIEDKADKKTKKRGARSATLNALQVSVPRLSYHILETYIAFIRESSGITPSTYFEFNSCRSLEAGA